jgi:hypothetical protein
LELSGPFSALVFFSRSLGYSFTMQTAGIVLDIYDNPRDLKTIFPSVDVIPDSVKIAHSLSSDELAQLPDDVFALVLLNDGDRLRKFACVDEGNTMLNVGYFFLHGHKLPEEAQKVAAANLSVACGWYGLEVPEELEKIALGLGTVMNAAMIPGIVKGTGGQIRDNLAATRAAGGTVMPPHQQHAMSAMMKGAEVSGTSLAPNQDPGDLSQAGARGKPGSSNTNVTNLEPTVKTAAASYGHSAYQGSYPLDSYTQVEHASRYFDDNMKSMPPEMRHEFASNLVKRASALGIEVSDVAVTYGSETFAPSEQIKVAMDTRRPHLSGEQQVLLDDLYDRRAALGPSGFCSALSDFDKVAKLEWRYDHSVMDPYASTYGVQKTAADQNDSWIEGNDYITKKQLENYAVTGFHTLKHDYGDDFAKEFKKDAWGIFSSLPVDQKRRIARAAGDNSATGMYDVD